MNDEEGAISAEAELREAIRDAYETASRALHDSTEWESIAYPNDRTIYEYFELRIVDAAKNYFYKRSRDYDAAFRDTLRRIRKSVDEIAECLQ